MIIYICDWCDRPKWYGCPCVTDPIDVRRVQRRLTKEHQAAVKRARPARRAAA